MKRKISVTLGILLIALLSVFFFPAKSQADPLTDLYNNSAVQVIVPNPVLINKSGDKVVDNNIKLDSDWAVPQLGTEISGQYYFQIGGDEYVLADDVYPYRSSSEIIKVTSDVPVQLYTYDGKVINNRMLAPNTSWYSDRIVGDFGYHGDFYYLRVATNEFVKSTDITTIMN